MLLSLLKILFFFAVVLLLALGAQHLAASGEPLRLVWQGTEYTLGPIQTVVALLVLVLAGWLAIQILRFALAFVRFLGGDRTAIDRYFDRARERKGYEALAEGMLAVASGEGRLAQDKAAKAAKYLDKPHVTNVLAAQAAEIAGDEHRAEGVYRDMLADERTRFVAVRGLMRQKLQLGDTHTALLLAQKAYALKPSHGEVQDTLLRLQTSEGDWKGARATLRDKRKQGAIPSDLHLRRDAVLALQEAKGVLAEGASISAREAAISANRASPDLVPAAVLAARSYLEQKDPKNAARVLERTWHAQPHPALAATYAQIVPDERPADRLKRFEKLIAAAPTDEESRLLQAELMIAAEDFAGARRALGNIVKKHPTVRSLSIMAAIERGQGASDAVVQGWLTRALTASRGKQWVCGNCHNVMADWAPVCDSCGAFDTLSWTEPETDRRMAAGLESAAMLPLTVRRGEPHDPVALLPDMDEDDAATETAMGTATGTASGAPPAGRAGAVAQRIFRRPEIDANAPGMVREPVDEAPAPAPAAPAPRPAPAAPSVAPGMVPRESDFADYSPSATVTDAEPVEAAPVRPRPVSQPAQPPVSQPAKPPAETPAATSVDTPAEAPVILPPPAAKASETRPAPDIEPPPRAPASPEAQPGNPPVRPDILPFDPASDDKNA